MALKRTKVVRLAKMLHDAGIMDDGGCIAKDAQLAKGRHEWYPEIEMLRFGGVSVDMDEWRADGRMRIRASGLSLDDAVRVVALLAEVGRGR